MERANSDTRSRQAAEFEGAGDFQPGEVIAGTEYVVRKFLGEGGHATAYECENRIGKRIALKVIHRHLAARTDLVERMVDEARRTVQLRHRNIVEVNTAGMTGGDRPRAFIEMELLNGSNGRQLLLLKERLEVPHALDVLIDICHALDAAHRAGLVHQDLKPDNIFIHLDEWNGKAVTKLLDFGVARMLGQGQEGTFEGTLAYAAPEQLRGEAVVPATDLYALGVIAFELVTGRRPFEAAETRDDEERRALGSSVQAGFAADTDFTTHMVNATLHDAPPRLCDYARIPRAFEEIVLQLLSKTPGERPASAKAVANALQAIRQSPSMPRSIVTTQEILVHAAQAPKLAVAKGDTLRIATVQRESGEARTQISSPGTVPLPGLKVNTPQPKTLDVPVPGLPRRRGRAGVVALVVVVAVAVSVVALVVGRHPAESVAGVPSAAPALSPPPAPEVSERVAAAQVFPPVKEAAEPPTSEPAKEAVVEAPAPSVAPANPGAGSRARRLPTSASAEPREGAPHKARPGPGF